MVSWEGSFGQNTFKADILVDILFQSFVVIVNFTLILYNVAFRSVVGWVDRNDVALIARVLDFLCR